jgi:hypothetical protein
MKCEHCAHEIPDAAIFKPTHRKCGRPKGSKNSKPAWNAMPLISKEIVERYWAGDTLKTLAAEFSVSQSQVRKASRHYGRPSKRGDFPNQRRYSSWEEHFWAKVDKSSDCWIWRGVLNQQGYGQFHDCRMPEKHARATHVAYRLSGQVFPAGAFLCHACDNPPCVRPDHLFAGTPDDNVQDMISKGRVKYVIPPPELSAKLTALDVWEIRRTYELGLASQYALARKFGVHQTQIGRIINRVNWKAA